MEQSAKISANTFKVLKQIKKEHFIKTILWASAITLTTIWMTFLIVSLIPIMTIQVLSEDLTILSSATANIIKNGNYAFIQLNTDGVAEFKEILSTHDANPFYEYVGKDPIALMFLIFAPVGYLGIIFIVAIQKNMITPSSIKNSVRKALQFGYLKQKDVDYIVDEVDYNIGIKERDNEQVEEV